MPGVMAQPSQEPPLLSGGGRGTDAWKAILFSCPAGKECAEPPLSYSETLSGLLPILWLDSCGVPGELQPSHATLALELSLGKPWCGQTPNLGSQSSLRHGQQVQGGQHWGCSWPLSGSRPVPFPRALPKLLAT